MTNTNPLPNQPTQTQTYFGKELYDFNTVSQLIKENNVIDWKYLS